MSMYSKPWDCQVNGLLCSVQTVLIVESVSTVIRYDSNLKKQVKRYNSKKAL